MAEATSLAALNNAEWCDAISVAHGAPGRFEASFWINPGSAPPFYPNLVTLDPDRGVVQREAVRLLKHSGLPSFGVKDSFSNLDPADLGLAVAFEADWLRLESDRAPAFRDPRYPVVAVTSASDLARWEAAWSDGAAPQTIFPPAILLDARVAFLALVINSTICAGAAINRSARTVGLSNVFFAPGMDAAAGLAALLSAAREHHPDMALTGYEDGESLALFRDAGFSSVGRLRVWIGHS
ncbi:hypothetical protein LB518_14910 [Mesorhizobium sp. BR1-1-16]|uniref:hypothetical protein n=1 Tax=Mesorhizobium sp. BR1-1-16 TaxID=2876653 RepID=UPI001CCF022B|nr:hypothetical protein [Mesorhizobium sp. BR1-1-16]MBZ9937592.1 hypothetical protein [Mesorhizobium sp. BR1-1-16]